MTTLIRANVEALAIALLSERLTMLPPWTDAHGNTYPAVSSETPSGWADAVGTPFVAVAQAGTRPERLCMARGPAAKEVVSLNVDCFGSGRAPIDPAVLIDPATGEPFRSTKVEAHYLAQCVASALEAGTDYQHSNGELCHARTTNTVWLPDRNSDRSRYIVTAQLTVISH